MTVYLCSMKKEGINELSFRNKKIIFDVFIQPCLDAHIQGSSQKLKEAPEDTSNYQVAFWISAFLLGLASAVHLFAFFVKKAHAAKKTPSPSHAKA